MEFSFRARICSTLQVVALIVCYRGNVSGEIAQDCVESLLSLRCPEMKVIKVIDVVLGKSECLWKSCCIKDQDCTRAANKNHRTHVQRRCDDKQSCTVEVLKTNITCGYLNYYLINNDFERITYNCSDEPRNDTLNSTVKQPTGDKFKNGSEPRDSVPAEEQTADLNNLVFLGIVFACVICLVVIIGIVASVSVIVVRRKKRRQVKSSDAVKTSDMGIGGKEATYVNEALGTSLNKNNDSSFPIFSNVSSKEVEKSLNGCKKALTTPACDVRELEGVVTGRIQSDSEYEELDDERNYEHLIVYEQLKQITKV